jgi:hypothetical protein
MSGFAEWASLYDAYAFPDCDKLTGRECRILLNQPAAKEKAKKARQPATKIAKKAV